MRNLFFLSGMLTLGLVSCSHYSTLPDTTLPFADPTLELRQTSTPGPAPTSTPEESEAPSPTATLQAFESVVSPNGEWVAHAYLETEHPSGKQTIEIVNKEGRTIWQIPFQGESSTGNPRPLMVIYQWSPDSSQLYFYYAGSPGDGEGTFGWTGHDLQKIDVKTGEVQQVLPGKGFMSFTISPQGTQILYIREQDKPRVIFLRDLVTGKEKAVYVVFGPKRYVTVGNIHWAPSGKKIVFQTETADFKVQTILLNPVTMKQRIIKQFQPFTLWLDGWQGDGKLQYSEISGDGVRVNHVYQIDANTYRMTLIGTPTARP